MYCCCVRCPTLTQDICCDFPRRRLRATPPRWPTFHRETLLIGRRRHAPLPALRLQRAFTTTLLATGRRNMSGAELLPLDGSAFWVCMPCGDATFVRKKTLPPPRP